MMHKQNKESRLRAALQNKYQKAVEAYPDQSCVWDTSVADLCLLFESLQLDFEALLLPFEGFVNTSAAQKSATKPAIEPSQAMFDPSNRVYFTCSASNTDKTKQNKYSAPAGDEAGLAAVSRCLSLATSDLLYKPKKTRKAPRITILTHCEDTLRRLQGARNAGLTGRPVQATPALVEVVKKSRFLRRKLGARLELQWLPDPAFTTIAERHAPPAEAANKPAAEATRQTQTKQTNALSRPTLPSLQHELRRDQKNLKTNHCCAYQRQQKTNTRKASHGCASRQQTNYYAPWASPEKLQADYQELISENFGRLKLTHRNHLAVCWAY